MKQVIERLHELLQKEIPTDRIRKYYIGIPEKGFSDDLLPAIATEFVSNTPTFGATSMDNMAVVLDMWIVTSKTRGISAQHNKGKRPAYEDFVEMIMGLDSSDGIYNKYKKGTVMKVLREHILLQGETQNTAGELSYNMTPVFQFAPRDDKSTLYICKVRLSLNFIIMVENR